MRTVPQNINWEVYSLKRKTQTASDQASKFTYNSPRNTGNGGTCQSILWWSEITKFRLENSEG